MEDIEVNKEQEIQQVNIHKPHVVILGAGASIAATHPLGDKSGKKLPSMLNLTDVVGLNHIVEKLPAKYRDYYNFEDLYSELHNTDPNSSEIKDIEILIHKYFSSLELSDSPNLYDYLILSLRETDIIATFNWDPFLMQAYLRNIHYKKLPRLAFLHGNVTVGLCEVDKTKGLVGNRCSKCGHFLTPSKLLFPVSEKNYNSDLFIEDEWNTVRKYLEDAFMVTIFGYSAPVTDKSAIDLLKLAWGDLNARNMEQVEIIDLKNEDALAQTWSDFIFSHHYTTTNSFYESFLANHPRRSGEAYYNQYYMAKCIEDNPIPNDLNFSELWNWFKPLLKAEKKNAR